MLARSWLLPAIAIVLATVDGVTALCLCYCYNLVVYAAIAFGPRVGVLALRRRGSAGAEPAWRDPPCLIADF